MADPTKIAPARAFVGSASADLATAPAHFVGRSDSADEKVEDIVRQLHGMCQSATLAFTISVGSLIIDKLYAGNFDAWRHRGAKTISFRRLARHPNLPMSAGALYRCVAIYEMCQRFNVEEFKHVSTSHLRLLLPFPPDTQAHLLGAVEAHRWPVRRLQHEIESLAPERSSKVGRGGRKRKSPQHRVQQGLKRCADILNELSRAVDELSPDGVQELADFIHTFRKACRQVEDRLGCGAHSSQRVGPTAE